MVSKGEKRLTVCERIAKLSGVDPKEREARKQQEEKAKQSEEMRQVMDKKLEKNYTIQAQKKMSQENQT